MSGRGNLAGQLVATFLGVTLDRAFYVYIMTNPRHTVLYTGVTSNLPRRVYEHREKLSPGFTSKYNVVHLVYYETAETAEAAISREKQLKAGPRRKKVALLASTNPTWRDLSIDLLG